MQLEAGRTAAVTRAFYILLIAVFVLAPLFVVVAVSLNRVAFTAFPPRGLSLRWYQAVLTDPQWRASLTVSLWIAAVASLLAACAGTLGAIGLHRGRFPGRDALVAGFLSPIVLPGLNTAFMGLPTEQGVWEERCAACGSCILGLTGGICPIARCAKQLLNGPCGGSQNGLCEIGHDTPCAWQLIYDRLKAQNRLHLLMEIQPAKNWSTSRDGGPRRIAREDLRLAAQVSE